MRQNFTKSGKISCKAFVKYNLVKLMALYLYALRMQFTALELYWLENYPVYDVTFV